MSVLRNVEIDFTKGEVSWKDENQADASNARIRRPARKDALEVVRSKAFHSYLYGSKAAQKVRAEKFWEKEE